VCGTIAVLLVHDEKVCQRVHTLTGLLYALPLILQVDVAVYVCHEEAGGSE
jgi:hypothetical protein